MTPAKEIRRGKAMQAHHLDHALRSAVGVGFDMAQRVIVG
jgi:hypothetical protein